jgi:hypothetical protein
MPIPQPQQRTDRKVGAGRLTPDDKPVGPELVSGVGDQPGGSVLAVLRACRIRMLGCEPIVDAEHGDTGVTRERRKERVLVGGRAERPTTTVQMQEHTPDDLRSEHPDRNVTGAARDGPIDGLVKAHRRRQRTAAALPVGADLHRVVDNVHRGNRRHELSELPVERTGLVDLGKTGGGHTGDSIESIHRLRLTQSRRLRNPLALKTCATLLHPQRVRCQNRPMAGDSREQIGSGRSLPTALNRVQPR